MNLFKKLLSYIYPLTIEEIRSEHNQFLEIVLFDGKYSLNSRNTNYSYGTLYILFKKIFRVVEIDWKNVRKVLILGFGTGSVAELINQYQPLCSIKGVEIDDKIIELGKKYFRLSEFRNVELSCCSAEKYLYSVDEKFDLIIIDVFNDMFVPGELETEKFIFKVRESLNKNGTVIFNKVVYSKSMEEQIPVLQNLYQKVFGNLKLLTIMDSGKIFVSEKL